jgi:hypothetical protein
LLNTTILKTKDNRHHDDCLSFCLNN